MFTSIIALRQLGSRIEISRIYFILKNHREYFNVTY